MKSLRLLSVGTLVAAAAASAVAVEPTISIGVGRSDQDVDTAAGAASADMRDTSYKLFGGAMLTPHLGVEASLLHLGEAHGPMRVGGGLVEATSRVRALAVYGVGRRPLANDLALYVKLGAAYTRAKVSTAVGIAPPLTNRESSMQAAGGVGLSYALTRNVDIRGEWERMRVAYPGGDKGDGDLYSLGLVCKF